MKWEEAEWNGKRLRIESWHFLVLQQFRHQDPILWSFQTCNQINNRGQYTRTCLFSGHRPLISKSDYHLHVFVINTASAFPSLPLCDDNKCWAFVICFKQPKSPNLEKSPNPEKWRRSEKNASPTAQKWTLGPEIIFFSAQTCEPCAFCKKRHSIWSNMASRDPTMIYLSI